MSEASLGRHLVVEYFECNPELINDVPYIERAMVEAAEEAGATIINSTFHHFSPFGVSGVVVIQESHLAIHTWPEYGYASVDIYTCGEPVDPWRAFQYLKEKFASKHSSVIEMLRGQPSQLKKVPFEAPASASPLDPATLTPEFKRHVWFTDRDEFIALSLRHTGDRLYRVRSPYQLVEVYQTYAYGKMLACDGMVMTTEGDEYVYHEMIAHVPLLLKPDAERVLIIGGGDGGAAREVLRHSQVKEVVLVEIDEKVIEAARLYFPDLAQSFDHPKLNLIIGDGIEYVSKAAEGSFDVVIVDSTDPVGPAEGLFTEAFYRDVYRILGPTGVMVTQSESPRFNVGVFQQLYRTYGDVFGPENAHCYLISVPTYPSGTWSLSFNTKSGIHPIRDLDEARAAAFTEAHGLKYYSPAIHKAAFTLPRYVQELLEPQKVTA